MIDPLTAITPAILAQERPGVQRFERFPTGTVYVRCIGPDYRLRVIGQKARNTDDWEVIHDEELCREYDESTHHNAAIPVGALDLILGQLTSAMTGYINSRGSNARAWRGKMLHNSTRLLQSFLERFNTDHIAPAARAQYDDAIRRAAHLMSSDGYWTEDYKVDEAVERAHQRADREADEAVEEFCDE